MRNWYEFISVYYRLNVVFNAFIEDPRYRFDLLRTLQGDVYDSVEPVALTKMRAITQQVESDPDHPWHQYLGGLRATSQSPVF